MTKKKKILLAIAIALFLICIISCAGAVYIIQNYESIYANKLSNSSLQVGQEAPDFELTTLEGEKITLSQFRGSPMILTIGTTWCPDCQKEAPLLQELHLKHPELTILMVDSKENSNIVNDFKNKYGITYTIALDPKGLVYDKYRVFAIPTLLVLDENGVVKARIIESVNADTLNDLLESVPVSP